VAVELSPQGLRDIENALSKVLVQGHRYSEQSERMVDH